MWETPQPRVGRIDAIGIFCTPRFAKEFIVTAVVDASIVASTAVWDKV
jgi:hypothetical protein